MKYLHLIILVLILLFQQSKAQKMERSDIKEQYKWDLTHLYKNVDEWKASLKTTEDNIVRLSSFKGRLSEKSSLFFEGLSLYESTLKDLYKQFDYAQRLSDEDLRISQNQSLSEEISALGTKFSEAVSFIRPEILNIDQKIIEQFFLEKKDSEKFRMFVENIQRMKPHTLTDSEEKILAAFGLITDTPSTVYNIFGNAEMPNPSVELSNGENAVLNASGFTKYRNTSNRKDREKIFSEFFENYGKFKNTIGANLAGKVKADYVYAKNRNYSTSLEASLNTFNIPVSVYENLILQINKNLPTLHRFLDLKRKMLGLDTLHYHDLYVPLVKEVKMNFDIPTSEKIIISALSPLGADYALTLNEAFYKRWIDYYPTKGKRSGAYSSGSSYDHHPYILMNWNDDYESLTTLVHELGHTMHSYLSNKNQPFINSDYAIFVAEIASTLNENLLNDYMVKNAKSKEEKLYLLGSYLELLRTTIFRQVSFAEFEWEIHKYIEEGKPLTGEVLSQIYYEIVKKYYGHDLNICIVDPYIAYEWAYIPHFVNYTYYVYQYSTSLIYSTAFAEKIIEQGKPAVDKYFEILKGGSSDYPIELIKKAGIDPLSSIPFELTMKRMNDVMDQIESLIIE